MANRFYIMVTKQNLFIICEPRWIENPTIGCYTKVFQSPDASNIANFTLAPRYYIKSSVDSCYEVFVIKKYQSREQAEKYTSRMRPKYPIRKNKTNVAVFGNAQKFRFAKPKTVDYIDLDCDIPNAAAISVNSAPNNIVHSGNNSRISSVSRAPTLPWLPRKVDYSRNNIPNKNQPTDQNGSVNVISSITQKLNKTRPSEGSNTTIETDSAEADISFPQINDVNHTLESSGSTQSNQTEADFESNLSESSISDVENDAGEQTRFSTTVETDSAEAGISNGQRSEFAEVSSDVNYTDTTGVIDDNGINVTGIEQEIDASNGDRNESIAGEEPTSNNEPHAEENTNLYGQDIDDIEHSQEIDEIEPNRSDLSCESDESVHNLYGFDESDVVDAAQNAQLVQQKYDGELTSIYTYTDNIEGDRQYLNGTVALKREQIRKLKNMNKSSEYDSKFIGYILSIVFGDDVLKNNSSPDPQKLDFIQSIKDDPRIQ